MLEQVNKIVQLKKTLDKVNSEMHELAELIDSYDPNRPEIESIRLIFRAKESINLTSNTNAVMPIVKQLYLSLVDKAAEIESEIMKYIKTDDKRRNK